MRDHEGEVIEGEVGGPAQGADHGTLLVCGLPGQRVWPGGVVEAVSWPSLAPFADGLAADAVAPGQHAGGFARAGNLGTDGGGGAGIRVDLQHGSLLTRCVGAEALEAISILYNRKPHRVPTMLRD
jgi:hypothetical protein